MSDPISSEWAELTIIRCEQSKVLIELKLGSDSQGSGRIVANLDINRFWGSQLPGGRSLGSEANFLQAD
jgi:hypothetical protein